MNIIDDQSSLKENEITLIINEAESDINSYKEKEQQTIDLEPPCPHYSVILKVKISIFETIMCYFCCFIGIISIFIACFIKCKSQINGESFNYGRPSINASLFFYDNHWLYNYGFESDFVNQRIESNRKVNEANCCCLGLKYPHFYKIKCSDCGFILKKGHEIGTFGGAILIGIVGIIIIGFTAFFVFVK